MATLDVEWNPPPVYDGGLEAFPWQPFLTGSLLVVGLLVEGLHIYVVLRVRARGKRNAHTLVSLFLGLMATAYEGYRLTNVAATLVLRAMPGGAAGCAANGFINIFAFAGVMQGLFMIARLQYNLVLFNRKLTEKRTQGDLIFLMCINAVGAGITCLYPGSVQLVSSRTYCLPALATPLSAGVLLGVVFGPSMLLVPVMYVRMFLHVRRMGALKCLNKQSQPRQLQLHAPPAQSVPSGSDACDSGGSLGGSYIADKPHEVVALEEQESGSIGCSASSYDPPSFGSGLVAPTTTARAGHWTKPARVHPLHPPRGVAASEDDSSLSRNSPASTSLPSARSEPARLCGPEPDVADATGVDPSEALRGRSDSAQAHPRSAVTPAASPPPSLIGIVGREEGRPLGGTLQHSVGSLAAHPPANSTGALTPPSSGRRGVAQLAMHWSVARRALAYLAINCGFWAPISVIFTLEWATKRGANPAIDLVAMVSACTGLALNAALQLYWTPMYRGEAAAQLRSWALGCRGR